MTHSLGYDWATITVLWRRDLLRFLRQPSRLVGALGQPVIFWVIIGSGMANTFRLPGSALSYQEYFFPGVVMMIGLFASIFASVSVIDDRHQGFLQAVVAGPGSRLALVLGKCLGSASVAMLQMALFLCLAPLAGFALGSIDWGSLALAALLSTVGLSALGFAVAWALDNVQAYHAIQMTLLVPAWVVSGAMFPYSSGDTVFAWAMACNPLAYAVCAVRTALYHGAPPPGTVLPMGQAGSLLALALFALVALGLAWLASRKD
jgi:daunorubicin resistance ABC transporter membrane protein